MTRKRIVIERRYPASLAEVWQMWTTREGIESWWGPDGFDVTVVELDLRAGGTMRYTMNAVAPEMVAFMQQAGMPTRQPCRVTFLEVTPPTRLHYTNLVDFVPGVKAYDVETLVELRADGDHTRLTLTLDPMHDDTWTQRAVMGWESELGKLTKVLASRHAR